MSDELTETGIGAANEVRRYLFLSGSPASSAFLYALCVLCGNNCMAHINLAIATMANARKSEG